MKSILIKNSNTFVQGLEAKKICEFILTQRESKKHYNYLYFGIFKEGTKWVVFDNRAKKFNINKFKDHGEALEWLEEGQEEDFRVCSLCNSVVQNGYVVGDGLEYYCSDNCLNKKYTSKEWNELYNEDCGYYTEFDYSY